MKHIFVLGCQRSGTVLMGQMLGVHGQAILVDERDGLYRWARAAFQDDDHTAAFERCCLAARDKYREPGTRFQDSGALRPHIHYAVLQAPNLTFQYNRMSSVLPQAKIVFMYRDIRDVVSSMVALSHIPILQNQTRFILSFGDLRRRFPTEVSALEQGEKGLGKHVKLAMVAKLKMSLSAAYKELGFEVVEVRYEDLVTKKLKTIASVLQQLGLPADDDCVRHEQLLQGFGPGKTPRARAVDDTSVGKWKKRLSAKESAEVWELAGDFMMSKGYRA
jgi:hypothetical protein